MKKILILGLCGLFFLALSSCIQNGNKQANATIKKTELNILLDTLVSKCPNMMNNDITKTDFADTLTRTLSKYQGKPLGLLQGLKMEFEMCMPYPNDSLVFESDANKYIVKFGFSESDNAIVQSDKYTTTFQIFSIVDKKTASQLVENSFYELKGTFRDFVNCKGSFTLPSGKCFEGYPKISELDSKPYIDMGTLIVDNLTFTKVK